jgi:hypothetical protein
MEITNNIIGYAAFTPDGDIVKFGVEEYAEAAKLSTPIPIVHLEEITR